MPTVETATINSVALSIAGAWEVADLTPLLQEGSGRGSNVVVPGVAGVIHRQSTLASILVSLPMFIYGDNDQASSAHPDTRTGLKDNVAYLNTNLLDSNVGDVTCTVTFPDASTITGSVAVERITVQNLSMHATVLRGVLRVRLLDGVLD